MSTIDTEARPSKVTVVDPGPSSPAAFKSHGPHSLPGTGKDKDSLHRGHGEADAVPVDARAKKRAGLSPSARKVILAGVGVVVAVVASHFAYTAYVYESTDNAMVGAHATLLSSKVSGIIIRSDVEENQKVKAGQVLAEIRPDDYQNALEQAQADVDSFAAQVKAAEAGFNRARDLFRNGAATHERLDDAEAQFHSLEGKLNAAQARLAQARLNLDYTKILAPTDGKVGKKSFEIGMFANQGQPLVGFVANDERWVVANFKETQMDRVTVGKPATVEVDAVPGREFDGVVESISPSTGATFSLLPPDNATGNFTKVVQRVPVRIKLLNLSEPDMDRLQVGLSAEVWVKVR